MKRRISLLAESLDHRRGGAEIYLAELVQFFTQAGHPVRAYVRRPVGGSSAAEIEVVPTLPMRGWVRDWHFARAIRRRLAGTNDIVFSTLPLDVPEITHYLSPAALYRTGFEAERTSFDPGLRRRFSRLGNCLNLQRQWLLTAQERLLTREPRVKVLTFSTAARTHIVELFRAPAEHITSIPPGVDLTRFHPGPPARQRSDPLRLLFAGQNFRLKGLHCLLRAMAEAARRGLRADLRVIGGGSSGAFKALAGSLGLADHVRFLGSVDADAVPEWYRRSDALVHPTFADHCSLVVLEALASGLPVITTRANGAAELIESGREGFVIEDPRDIGALAATLLCLQDRENLDAMRAAAITLRPRLGSADHARRVLAWLTSE